MPVEWERFDEKWTLTILYNSRGQAVDWATSTAGSQDNQARIGARTSIDGSQFVDYPVVSYREAQEFVKGLGLK